MVLTGGYDLVYGTLNDGNGSVLDGAEAIGGVLSGMIPYWKYLKSFSMLFRMVETLRSVRREANSPMDKVMGPVWFLHSSGWILRQLVLNTR